MKPFNLERALAGDPVVTRSGIQVVKLHMVPNEFKAWAPLYVLLENGLTINAHKNGEPSGDDSSYDLLMGPVKKKMWANLYLHDGTYSIGPLSKSKDGAFCSRGPHYFSTIPIEWEE